VSYPPALGNDQVEGLAERVFLTVAEDRLGAAVPQPDDAPAIRVHDGVRHGIDDPLEQIIG
jgi:hypothetical protein